MPEATVAAARAWRGIDELGRLVGAYCWVEQRIFELTGTWASLPPVGVSAGTESGMIELEAERRVWCAAASGHHGDLASRWAERLPARAGVDRDSLVAAPGEPLAGALDVLGAETDSGVGVAVLVRAVLPRLDAAYLTHLRSAAPVREAPVIEVLAGAHRLLREEMKGGRPLVEGLGMRLERAAQLGELLERPFEQSSIFPAVRPS